TCIAAHANERRQPRSGLKTAGHRANSNSWAHKECLMLRIGFFVLAPSLVFSHADAEEAKVAVQLRGAGALTCAHWHSTAASRAEGAVWLFGYWSELNYVAAASEQVQAKSDEKEVIAEVVRVCTTNPSQVLASAVREAYVNFSRK